jgi:hypothetical protein
MYRKTWPVCFALHFLGWGWETVRFEIIVKLRRIEKLVKFVKLGNSQAARLPAVWSFGLRKTDRLK